MTTVERLGPIDVEDAFRVMCEFDAERSELFFSRAAILVEGMTEKIALPVVFHALGHDADREQISIVECGGKSNLPLFVEICKRARVPCVVVHDSDLRPGREPPAGRAEAERAHPPTSRRAAHDRPRPGLRRHPRVPQQVPQARTCIAPSGARARGRTAGSARARREARARLGSPPPALVQLIGRARPISAVTAGWEPMPIGGAAFGMS